jgi:hypothetical protein
MVFGRIGGYLRFLLSYRRKVFSLRKKYDKTREKADKLGNPEKRLTVLRILDNIEPTLVMLEEQRISRFDRGRMFRIVRNGIDQAKREIKTSYQYTEPVRKPAVRY